MACETSVAVLLRRFGRDPHDSERAAIGIIEGSYSSGRAADRVKRPVERSATLDSLVIHFQFGRLEEGAESRTEFGRILVASLRITRQRLHHDRLQLEWNVRIEL